jgi:hypothetical protein
VSHCFTNAVRLMTNDGIHIARGNNLRGCGNYMRQQWFASDLMQNFWMFGFQARPFARRHNGNGDVRDAMRGAALNLWHSIQYTARLSSAAANPAQIASATEYRNRRSGGGFEPAARICYFCRR